MNYQEDITIRFIICNFSQTFLELLSGITDYGILSLPGPLTLRVRGPELDRQARQICYLCNIGGWECLLALEYVHCELDDLMEIPFTGSCF